MAKKTNEPECLRRGKEFHRYIQQKNWISREFDKITIEKSVTKKSYRRGRIDIFIEDKRGIDKLVAVIEIKASDWDSMTEKAVKRNARRYIKQIWDYIESIENIRKDISPGVIFPKKPIIKGRKDLVEDLFNENLITVVWEDEVKEVIE